MFQGYLCGCFKINPPEKANALLRISQHFKGSFGTPQCSNESPICTYTYYIYISIFIRIYGNICIYRLYFLVNLHHIYIYISWKLLICDISTWRQDIFLSWAPFFFSEPPEPEPPAGCGEIYKPRWLPTVGVWYFRKVPATNDFLRISWFSVYVYIY